MCMQWKFCGKVICWPKNRLPMCVQKGIFWKKQTIHGSSECSTLFKMQSTFTSSWNFYPAGEFKFIKYIWLIFLRYKCSNRKPDFFIFCYFLFFFEVFRGRDFLSASYWIEWNWIWFLCSDYYQKQGVHFYIIDFNSSWNEGVKIHFHLWSVRAIQ